MRLQLPKSLGFICALALGAAATPSLGQGIDTAETIRMGRTALRTVQETDALLAGWMQTPARSLVAPAQADALLAAMLGPANLQADFERILVTSGVVSASPNAMWAAAVSPLEGWAQVATTPAPTDLMAVDQVLYQAGIVTSPTSLDWSSASSVGSATMMLDSLGRSVPGASHITQLNLIPVVGP